tara:strand:+ start:1390 stop:1893 length:504 start_codon:yes stop_codon:yes gene_type:complete
VYNINKYFFSHARLYAAFNFSPYIIPFKMPIHPNKIRDLSFGYTSEENLLPLFRRVYGDKIVKSSDRFSFFDYSDDDSLIELKTRRINHDRFPTALCNLEKVKKLAADPRQAYLVFSYLDGVFQVPIKENWKYWTTRTNTRCDRGRNESAVVCLIPHTQMERLTDKC